MANSIRRKILLKGVTTTPDDYLSEDGELAGAMNVENMSGGMESVQRHGPEIVIDLGAVPARIVFEHKVKPESNFIVWREYDEQHVTLGVSGAIAVYKKTDSGWTQTTFSKTIYSKSLPKVEAIGNTLIIIAQNIDTDEYETHYVLWKKDEDGTYVYKYLGTHIPELDMRFGLTLNGKYAWDKENGEGTREDPWPPYIFTVDGLQGFYIKDASSHVAILGTGDEEKNSIAITSAIRAVINKNLSESMANGYFVQPFLVRYALKMYDNTHVMISQPVYMQVCDMNEYGGAPYCLVNDSSQSDSVKFIVAYIEGKLAYKVTSQSLNSMKDWSDIIKGVDVYVTPQIYTYTENDKITETIGANEEGKKYEDRMADHYCVGSIQPYTPRGRRISSSTPTTITDTFARRTAKSLVGGNVKTYAFNIGYKKKDEFYDEVRNFGQFYLLKSYSFDDLEKDKLTWIEIDKNVLNNISTSSVLERDSYHDQDELLPEFMYAYNGRLNLGGVRRKLYSGWNPSIMLPYQSKSDENKAMYQVCVEINNEGQFSTVHSAIEELPADQSFAYLYYPSTGATSMTIRRINDGKTKKFDLSNHQSLNGSVFFDGYAYIPSDFGIDKAFPEESNTTIDVLNKLHTSEAGNPWQFLPTNINTIGNGKVMGMAAVTTALSQGQHGSFPMYCFTSEGIYSLSTNNTGGWATSQAVTRDVIKEGTPLLQIDNAIVFVSEHGLMMLQGDKTESMSGDFIKKPSIQVSTLPGLHGLISQIDGITDVGKIIDLAASDREVDTVMTGNLMEYIGIRKGYSDAAVCISLYYDYTNQRVIVGRENRKYCWVCSLGENTWSTQPWHLLNRVNSYPDCYAMMLSGDGKHYMVKLNTDMSNDTLDAERLGLPKGMFLLTRPVKVSEYADVLKELENMTIEGRFDRSKVGMAVWGTRNYNDWHLIGSCKGGHLVRKHGSGYRAFVVALLGKIGEEDYIDSITMQINLRYEQKMHGMGYE